VNFCPTHQGGTSKVIDTTQVAESGGVKRLPAGDSLASAASSLVGPSQQVGSDRPEWCPRSPRRHWGSDHADEVDLPWGYSSEVPLWIPAALIAVGVLGLVVLCFQ
jgi:hypothetical protein